MTSSHTSVSPPAPGQRRAAGRVIAAAAIAAVIAGATAAPALADPPEQGGVSNAPEQGGVAPVPEQGGVASAPPAVQAPPPAPDYGPGIIASPPQEAAPVGWIEPQGPPSSYTPTPSGPPVIAAPVAPMLVSPDEIRVGTEVFPRGDIPKDVAISINEWAAYSEAKAAQAFVSLGWSEDEASRQAALAVTAAAIGGAIGATAAGVPTFVVTAIVTVPIGAAIGATIGSFVPPTPFNVVPGALIGAAAGAGVAAAVAAAAATAGGLAGAIIGGALGWALGAGDANADPDAPWESNPAPAPEQAPLPNPDGEQYNLVFNADEAGAAGLPAVDYTVSTDGAVDLSITGVGSDINLGWTAEQANAPYEALGPWGGVAKAAAGNITKQVGDAAQDAINGLDIDYPQLHPATA